MITKTVTDRWGLTETMQLDQLVIEAGGSIEAPQENLSISPWAASASPLPPENTPATLY